MSDNSMFSEVKCATLGVRELAAAIDFYANCLG
jgi:hypothetical protein